MTINKWILAGHIMPKSDNRGTFKSNEMAIGNPETVEVWTDRQTGIENKCEQDGEQ